MFSQTGGTSQTDASIKNTLEVSPVNNPLPSDAGIDGIAQFEGFVSSAQPDPIGIATVGFGHVVLPNESFAGPITRDQGLAMLRADVERVVIPSLDQVNVTLSQNQVDALASFIFNVGPTAFRRSTLLRELNNGNIERV